ncbi:MAG: hypothetical protein QOF33_231 [Thermomicrobiales bacterium]|jgi:hypothetical protein|nr:hypothetical protein [Thermomicrobiales bacterium]
MPQGRVPERYKDILESTTMGHLATVDERSHPQVNPVRIARPALDGPRWRNGLHGYRLTALSIL